MGEPMNLRGIKEDKDMKRLLAILSTVAALVACTNLDQPEPVDPADSRLIPVTFKVTKGDELLTKALSLDENASPHELHVTWNEGEEVLVYFYDIRLGTLYAAASDDNTTTLSGWIDTGLWDDERKKTENGGPLYFYYRTIPTHYDGQDGTLAKIATDYDFCVRAVIPKGGYTMTVDADEGKLIVNGVDYANNEIPSLQFGSNLQSIVRFRLLDESNNPINASSFTISAKKEGNYTLVKNWTPYLSTEFTYFDDYTGPMTITPAETAYSTNGDGILFASLRINTGSEDLSSDILLSATAGEKTYYYQKSSVTFEPGKYYEITVKMKSVHVQQLADVTAQSVGRVIGLDGNVYENAAAATVAGTTAAAMIVYVGADTGESDYPGGLAIALSDCVNDGYKYKTDSSTDNHTYQPSTAPFSSESGLQYMTDTHTNSSHPAFDAAYDCNYQWDSHAYQNVLTTIPGCSMWFLGTAYQWSQIITSMGGFAALRTAFSGIGGTDLAETNYWTSTEVGAQGRKAWYASFSGDGNLGNTWKTTVYKVRPILAFGEKQQQVFTPGTLLDEVDANSLGKVIATDGHIYASVSDATDAGATPVALIAYVGADTGESSYTRGLAIALEDYGTDRMSSALSKTLNHEVTASNSEFNSEGGLQYYDLNNSDDYPAFQLAFSKNGATPPMYYSYWFLGTGYQWKQMITGMGNFTNLRTAFNGIGGTDLAEANYWTSTANTSRKAWYVNFSSDGEWGNAFCYNQYYTVRPIIAF